MDLIVSEERPDLSTKRIQLIQQQNQFKIKLKELEADLLERLANSQGDILEDIAVDSLKVLTVFGVGAFVCLSESLWSGWSALDQLTISYVCCSLSLLAVRASLGCKRIHWCACLGGTTACVCCVCLVGVLLLNASLGILGAAVFAPVYGIVCASLVSGGPSGLVHRAALLLLLTVFCLPSLCGFVGSGSVADGAEFLLAVKRGALRVSLLAVCVPAHVILTLGVLL